MGVLATDGDSGPQPVSGPAIRSQRKKRGMSLSQLAAEVGISQTKLWALEKGKGRADTKLLEALSSTLGVGVAELISEQPSPGYDFMAKLVELAENVAFSADTWEMWAPHLRDYQLVVEAISKYQRLVRRAVPKYQHLGRTADIEPRIDEQLVSEIESIFGEPLGITAKDSFPRAWLLHESAKVQALFGNLAALGKITRDWQGCFQRAASDFREALAIKRRLGLKPQCVLSTELKCIEVELDRSYWLHKKGCTTSASLEPIAGDIDSVLARYHALTPYAEDKAVKHGVSHCLFVAARAHYVRGKFILSEPETVLREETALREFDTAIGLCREARDIKAGLDDFDGVLWADVLLAKCARRKALIRPSDAEFRREVETRYLVTLRSVNPSRLEDLRSICALTSVSWDIEEARRNREAWCDAILIIYPAPPRQMAS